MQIVCCQCKKEYSFEVFTIDECTLYIECSHCGSKHALDFIPFEGKVKKIPATKVTLGGGPYYVQLGGTRILSVNGTTDHSGADDGDITDWVKTTEFIVAVCIHSGGKDTESSTYKLQWQDDNDGGGYVDLAATGEANYTLDDTSWNHGDTVATGDQKCDIQGNDTRQAGERIKGQSLSDAIDLPDEYQSELWFGIDVSGSDDSHVYSFQLYSSAEGAAIGVCGATIAMEAGAVTHYLEGSTDSISLLSGAIDLTKKIIGTSDSISLLSGAFDVVQQIVGSTDSVSLLSSDLRIKNLLVGSSDSISLLSGIIDITRRPIGTSDSISLLSGDLTVVGGGGTTHYLIGSINSVILLSSAINVKRDLIGSTDSSSLLSGLMDVTREISSSSDSISLLSGIAEIIRSIVGQLDSVSTFSGLIDIKRDIAGSIDTISALLGMLDITGAINLAGLIDSISIFQGILIIQRELLGQIKATGSFVGDLSIEELAAFTEILELAALSTGQLEIKALSTKQLETVALSTKQLNVESED